MSMATALLIGRLARKPELRETGSGKKVTDFSLATNPRNKDDTVWIKVIAWEKTAQLCCDYLDKGRQVFVEGALGTEEYTTRDGEKRFNITVTASKVKFLGSRENEGVSRDGEYLLDKAIDTPPVTTTEDDVPF